MGNMPKPNAYEEGEDEHPHLAFEVDHTIFQSELIPWKYIWDWNWGQNFSLKFIDWNLIV